MILYKLDTYSANICNVVESTDYTPKKRTKRVKYWVVQTKSDGAYIVNHKPVVGVDGITEIHWSGFSETEAGFQLNRLISLSD